MRRRTWLKRKRVLIPLALLALISIGLLLPERLIIPVAGANPNDWNPETFWYEPWGASGVHKGIDIFAPAGRDVVAATSGLVVFAGNVARGGNVALVLGPKWRLHYYAHMQDTHVARGAWVSVGDIIGTVGTSGNAAGKPSHLHYVSLTLVPHPWRADRSTQGWKKMFYLDANQRLRELSQ